MGFLYSSELEDFSAVLRKFLADEIDGAYLRGRMKPEHGGTAPAFGENDVKIWERLAALGIFSAGLPEDCAGLDMGAIAFNAVLEETGRSLIPQPIFETFTFGALALLFCEKTLERDRILEQLACGALRISGMLEANKALVAHSASGPHGYILSGELGLVPSLGSVNALIVPARTSSGDLKLFYIDTLNLKAEVEALQTFDLLRTYHKLILSETPAAVIGKLTPAIFDLPLLTASAELSGIAAKVVEMTTEYVKTRKQFGRAVGSFQAVQHKLADMLMQAEQSRSLCRYAFQSLDADRSNFGQAAHAAKGFAGEYVPLICEQAIQVHGGIGFTYEYDLHLYLRRAIMLAQSFASSGECYSKLAERSLQ